MNQNPGFLIAILGFALVIGPLVFLHELGHYAVGRFFGVKAESFSIGFGHEVAGFTDRRGTRWKIAWLPLGGYVRFAGDMNPASQPDASWLSLPPSERERTFQAKPLWQRALIVLAGPATNFLVAAIILSGFALAYGESRPIVGAVQPGSAAAGAGLAAGDRITAIDDKPVSSFDELVVLIQPRPGQRVSVSFDRAGSPERVSAMIGSFAAKGIDGKPVRVGQIGIARAPVSLLRAPVAGIEQTGAMVGGIADGLGQIFTGQRSVKEMGGMIRIAQVSGQQLERGWISLLFLIALISVNLGFINLLPVPMLDGGHLLFYAIEAVQRRPVGQQTMEWAFRGGLAAVLLLVLVVTFNDLGAFGVWRSLTGLIG